MHTCHPRSLNHTGQNNTEAIQQARTSLIRNVEFFITVTVKDRINYVKLFAENLAWQNMSNRADVHVFDNGSRQFSAADLRTWFPHATIHSLDSLQDPDVATRRAFEYFIAESSIPILVNLDSDSLLHPEWASFVRKILPQSDGVLSLYHSAAPHHPTFNCSDVTCNKKTTGALGLVFHREVLKDALEQVVESESVKQQGFDWALCYYLTRMGKTIFVPLHSLILHYGLHGAHGDGAGHVEVDKGFNLSHFPPTIRAQARFYAENKFIVD